MVLTAPDSGGSSIPLSLESVLWARGTCLWGEGRKKVPSNDMGYIQCGYFSALGRAIVASILNGDCGFPYLAPCVFFYLIGQDCSSHLHLKDVPDLDIKFLCQQVILYKPFMSRHLNHTFFSRSPVVKLSFGRKELKVIGYS